MIKLRFLYLLLIPVIMFVAGCSKDEDPVTPPVTPTPEAQLLAEYLEGAGGDFINTTSCPAMISASALNTDIQGGVDLAIIDVRSATDYAAGHIAGAVNVTIANILNYYRTNNLQTKAKVVVTCYTGQSAAFAVAVLRLAGYTNVFDLKWGMCSWSDGARWHNTMINGQTNPITKQMTANVKANAGDLPTLSTGKTAGAEILATRLDTVLAQGYGVASISRDVMYQNLSNYYIVNYWPVADYDLGHVEGAIQYTPRTDLKLAAFLKTLPTNKTIVVYCYTGQTSAHIAVFLRALGYDAKSLSFGANNLFYDTMPGTKWVDTECMNYPVVQ
ncbi:MAG: rhodanese-like domain-containing protein [Ignavibacteriales bacterium]|nr:MAG: rhodanese-like domain-containing protein [Ignavibacteriales bacterium]